MSKKIYISPGSELSSTDLIAVSNVCKVLNLVPYTRRLDLDPDEPGPGEVVERRVDPLLTSDLLVIFLVTEYLQEASLDLFTARRENIPIVLVYKKGNPFKASLPDDLGAINIIECKNFDDALTELRTTLRIWANSQE